MGKDLQMRYLIIGAGGTGGTIGYALADAGHDVTLIARGEHLCMIRDNGLTVRHLWDGSEGTVKTGACTQDGYDRCDVKGYSVDEIIPLIDRAATEQTVIIPVLNIYTTGEYLREKLPGKYIMDGCMYVSANIESPGRIVMHSPILRVIFGCAPGQEERPVLGMIERELNSSGIRGIFSKNIRRDALKKFSYVSPIGAAGLYYDAAAGDFVAEGEKRDLFTGMMKEIEALAEAMGCPFDTDVIASNLKIAANQPPEATTSMQRDIYSGGRSEIQGLVFDVPETGRKYGLEMPLYSMVSETLRKKNFTEA